MVSTADLLRTIRGLDYEPEVVEAPGDLVVAAERIDPTSLPDDFQELFGRAKDLGRPVLVEFSGPGWVSCERMDAVTYPAPEVRAELADWLERRVDVAAERGLADTFQVAAVPTAVLLDHDGRVLDRVIGFVHPADFRQRLRSARAER